MQDVTFVILGATGDLTKRKVIPAIYQLLKEKRIRKLSIIGAARRDLDIKSILTEARSFIKRVNNSIWSKIEKASYYHPLDFYNSEDYEKLKSLIDNLEKKHRLPGNRLFYLATLPEHFDTITDNLAKTKLAKESSGQWSRLVYEKPFGSDLSSARKINHGIGRVFRENQVYRIDHYLGKELVGNISMLRFTNRILEPLWNSLHIDSIQVILKEKLGLEERGNFYDKYGALKDVVQNHMLQILALTAMEAPKKLNGEFIRNEKSKVLKVTEVEDVLLGQFEGYRTEKGVDENSNTETFAALKLKINNRRWQNVPIYLKTGKALKEKETCIYIKFKKATCLLEVCPVESNNLTIRVQPNEGFSLELFAKIPGEAGKVEKIKMDFSHQCVTKHKSPEAYQVLLNEVIKGDQSLFVRNDEIESAWTIIDKVEAKKLKVHIYEKGSDGPKELDNFEKKHGMRWIT